MKTISVIGGGYVGLVTAACFADLGHKVTLIEIAPDKLNALKHGVLPVHETGLLELWQRHRPEGRIVVTDNYAEGLCGSQFTFIAVGTPSTSNGKPDLKAVCRAARNIAEAARGPMTVVIKSTVPVGTAALVDGILKRYGPKEYSLPVVSNPEFLREGLAVYDFMHPNRVVIGSSEREHAETVAELYRPFHAPTILCDNQTAEMAKYVSNAFLATRISFMNEIAQLCDESGVDVVRIAEIMGLDPRFGHGYLSAGLGWGGSCLPKDVRALIHMAKSYRIPSPLMQAVWQINQQQPKVAIKKLRRLLGSLEGKTIGVLGLSFKPNSDDMREASSLSIIRLLEKQGCQVKAYDPLAMSTATKLMPRVICCADAYQVAKGSDALIIVTEWDEFKELDMNAVHSLMTRPIIIDGRNLYDPEEMTKAGFVYEGIGHRAVRSNKLGVALLNETRR